MNLTKILICGYSIFLFDIIINNYKFIIVYMNIILNGVKRWFMIYWEIQSFWIKIFNMIRYVKGVITGFKEVHYSWFIQQER